MKPKHNAFLTYWPWLLPIGILLWTAALMLRHFHVLPDYWAGFMLGFCISSCMYFQHAAKTPGNERSDLFAHCHLLPRSLLLRN